MHLATHFGESTRRKSTAPHRRPIISLVGAIALILFLGIGEAHALRRGDRGSQVKALQQQLRDKGYFNGPKTGYYGSMTQAAVKRFQKAKGLKVDGIVGSKTLVALQGGETPPSPDSAMSQEAKTMSATSESATPSPSQKPPLLKPGSLGLEVVRIQVQLKRLGYFKSLKYGYYGFLTQASVREFQRDRGLKVDGIVGPQTWAALAEASAQTPPVSAPQKAAAQTPPVSPPKTERQDVRPTAVQSPATPPAERREDVQFKIDTSTRIPPLEIKRTEASAQPTPSPTPTESPQEMEVSTTELLNLEGGLNTAIAFLQNPTFVEAPPRDPSGKMTHLKTITGGLSPKSIVHSGTGLFFAQNMMYRHTITIYDRTFELIKTIPDNIKLSDFGFSKFEGNYKGSPVEASFSPDGKFAYVANYKMYGPGFKRPGTDKCSPAGKHDDSFLYKIDTESLAIETAIQVGPVPKFNAVTPDGRFVLVSNWCGWDLSVVDTQTDAEIKRIKIGRYPRGIAVHPDSKTAYVAVMGSTKIARVNLEDFSVGWLNNVGRAPRHLNISPDGKFLYVTLNAEGKVAKLDLSTGKVIQKITTGKNPRSMAISDDGQFLYVVNYKSNTMSKVRTEDMKIIHSVRVNRHPIGITYDPQMRQVWVACYSGSVMVFQD